MYRVIWESNGDMTGFHDYETTEEVRQYLRDETEIRAEEIERLIAQGVVVDETDATFPTLRLRFLPAEWKQMVDAAAVKLTEQAGLKFWDVVAKAFPAAHTGDLDPMTTIRLDTAMGEAVRQWIENNVPSFEGAPGDLLPVICEKCNVRLGDSCQCKARLLCACGDNEHGKAGNFTACDSWECVCGNTPSLGEGFAPCNRAGVEVEPTAAQWPEPLYVCDRCGRIYDQTSGYEIGNRGPLCIHCKKPLGAHCHAAPYECPIPTTHFETRPPEAKP